MATTDWGEVHRRLKAAQDALGRGWAPTPEEKGEILRARRKVLAQEVEAVQTAEYLEVVEFLLAYETYGLESVYVREVYPLRELTPVPCTPPFVAGIVNVRGQILSVVDLKRFFDLPEKGLTDLNKIIVAQADGMELGILADGILGVRTVPLSELQPSLPTLTGIRAEYLKGVTRGRLVVLDGAAILSDKRLVVREEVGS